MSDLGSWISVGAVAVVVGATFGGHESAAMLLAVLALYVAVPIVVFVSVVIDLWAKSYDLPMAQMVAKVTLTSVVALGFTGATMLAGQACEAAATPLTITVVTALLSLPIATLLWLVHEVDWRSVYAGALMTPPATLIPGLQRRTTHGGDHCRGGQRSRDPEGGSQREVSALRSHAA